MSIYKSCIKLCPNCRKKCNDNNGIEDAYLPYLYDDDYECPDCDYQLLDTKITIDEFSIIQNISNTIGFLEAMIDLKEKDIIEYNLKMSQFRATQSQSKQVVEDNVPKCPTCGSTKLSKVPVASKASSVFLFGLLSQKVKKTWHCDNCKYEW